MDIKETAERFSKAFNDGDLKAFESLLADDFEFHGPMPDPLNKEQWLELTGNMHNAFPDLKYNFRIEKMDGNRIYASTQMTGTHKNDFDLSRMGIGIISATGKTFSNPKEHSEAEVKDGKIKAVYLPKEDNVGLMNIFKQLGVNLPGS